MLNVLDLLAGSFAIQIYMDRFGRNLLWQASRIGIFPILVCVNIQSSIDRFAHIPMSPTTQHQIVLLLLPSILSTFPSSLLVYLFSLLFDLYFLFFFSIHAMHSHRRFNPMSLLWLFIIIASQQQRIRIHRSKSISMQNNWFRIPFMPLSLSMKRKHVVHVSIWFCSCLSFSERGATFDIFKPLSIYYE